MQRLEVRGALRTLFGSLGVKELTVGNQVVWLSETVQLMTRPFAAVSQERHTRCGVPALFVRGTRHPLQFSNILLQYYVTSCFVGICSWHFPLLKMAAADSSKKKKKCCFCTKLHGVISQITVWQPSFTSHLRHSQCAYFTMIDEWGLRGRG